jgi:hypothetical protein
MDPAAFDRPTGVKRLLQCIEDKARRSGAAGPPAHDPSGIEIDNECDINEAAPAGDVCEIGHPELVRPVSGELHGHGIALSLIVVFILFPRATPCKPMAFMIRPTVQRATSKPSRVN